MKKRITDWGKRATSVRKSKPSFNPFKEEVPLVVAMCVAHLDEFALQTEDIFRQNVEVKTVANIIKQFDKGKPPRSWNESTDSHLVACVLKSWLVLQEEPLLTMELQDSFIAAQAASTKESKLRRIATVIQLLPPGNRKIFEHLILLFKSITQYSQYTKMTSYNLGVAFGPILLRKDDTDDISMMVQHSEASSRVVMTCIDNYEVLFTGDSVIESKRMNRTVSTMGFNRKVKKGGLAIIRKMEEDEEQLQHEIREAEQAEREKEGKKEAESPIPLVPSPETPEQVETKQEEAISCLEGKKEEELVLLEEEQSQQKEKKATNQKEEEQIASLPASTPTIPSLSLEERNPTITQGSSELKTVRRSSSTLFLPDLSGDLTEGSMEEDIDIDSMEEEENKETTEIYCLTRESPPHPRKHVKDPVSKIPSLSSLPTFDDGSTMQVSTETTALVKQIEEEQIKQERAAKEESKMRLYEEEKRLQEQLKEVNQLKKNREETELFWRQEREKRENELKQREEERRNKLLAREKEKQRQNEEEAMRAAQALQNEKNAIGEEVVQLEEDEKTRMAAQDARNKLLEQKRKELSKRRAELIAKRDAIMSANNAEPVSPSPSSSSQSSTLAEKRKEFEARQMVLRERKEALEEARQIAKSDSQLLSSSASASNSDEISERRMQLETKRQQIEQLHEEQKRRRELLEAIDSDEPSEGK